MKQKILVSACLLGESVRYDGKSNRVESEIIDRWREENRIVSVCPEIEGGFGVPRHPAEISKKEGSGVLNGQCRVLNRIGDDVTDAFISGAECTLKIAHQNKIQMAILKNRSPSCGSDEIYDGSFSGKLTTGQGVTAALLEKKNIKVFNESQLPQAVIYLQHIEATSL